MAKNISDSLEIEIYVIALEGENHISIMDRLRLNLSRHSGRASQSLDWAVSVGESLRKNFDTYVNSELNDLREQIELVKIAGYDVAKEDSELQNLELRFDKTNKKLSDMLESAKQGRLKSIKISKSERSSLFTIPKVEDSKEISPEEFDLDTLIEGFFIIGELEEIRKDIERWSMTHIRTIEQTISVFRELQRRGEI